MDEITLAAIAKHGWSIVLLGERSKRPIGETWQITTDPAVLRGHRGNWGLVCGPMSGVMVFDFDDTLALKQMSAKLGDIPVTVKTGSGKYHCYFVYEEGFPAKLRWDSRIVGEIQRGPSKQQVVMPPSIHKDTGEQYMWLGDPCAELTFVPIKWREYLQSEINDRPEYLDFLLGDKRGVNEEKWLGPPAEEIIARALQQPGAVRRSHGIKFQCPGCRDEGHDKSKDNALVGLDGRWACAVNREHARSIGAALGIANAVPLKVEDIRPVRVVYAHPKPLIVVSDPDRVSPMVSDPGNEAAHLGGEPEGEL